jgi:hypothetical protein
LDFIIQAGLIALILNISMMVIAYYLAKTFASGIRATKMYRFRVWIAKWIFSIICFNPNFWH